MTSILIAGSGGYVGSFLVQHLSEKFDVIAATRNHQPFSDKALEVIHQDLAQCAIKKGVGVFVFDCLGGLVGVSRCINRDGGIDQCWRGVLRCVSPSCFGHGRLG